MDLLNNYNLLPFEVQNILTSKDENQCAYSESKRMVKELKICGYHADYGLDGELTNLKVFTN